MKASQTLKVQPYVFISDCFGMFVQKFYHTQVVARINLARLSGMTFIARPWTSGSIRMPGDTGQDKLDWTS